MQPRATKSDFGATASPACESKGLCHGWIVRISMFRMPLGV